ncbi:hypothetical protein HDK77DRAFT_275210 [Phyllosticta capitalensis]
MPACWDRDRDARDEVQGDGDTDAAAPRATAAPDWTPGAVRAFARDCTLDRTCPATDIGCHCSEEGDNRSTTATKGTAGRQLSHSSRPALLLPPIQAIVFPRAFEAKTRLDQKHLSKFCLYVDKDRYITKHFLISHPSVIVAPAMPAPGLALCAVVSQPRQLGRKVRIPPRGQRNYACVSPNWRVYCYRCRLSSTPQPTSPACLSAMPFASGPSSSSEGDKQMAIDLAEVRHPRTLAPFRMNCVGAIKWYFVREVPGGSRRC